VQQIFRPGDLVVVEFEGVGGPEQLFARYIDNDENSVMVNYEILGVKYWINMRAMSVVGIRTATADEQKVYTRRMEKWD